ncbi:methyltransferase-like protein 2 isoform X2 [Abrus precatorius]|uniref:Methyltransferase-like protein 2 isoform X2 n=1 Tax=Abrus precatorius TaxID=3816 RepID=A0A8B8JL15_ABRPR|nr:methyltransferase-like protein 2 isoform X2 [Abrus precatorius]
MSEELSVMEDSQNLSLFYECGIYFFEDSNAVFMDPVRVLNRSYNRFRVSPSNYYSRFFKSPIPNPVSTATSSPAKRKRKRKPKEPPPLNQREQIALQRHNEARPLLLEAQERLVKSNELLDALSTFRSDSRGTVRECEGSQHSFVQLGREAPLLEVTLNSRVCHPDADPHHPPNDFEESPSVCCEQRVLPAFNNLVANDTKDDVVAEILNNHYIIPRESCFYMSDLRQIRNLLPAAHADSGFNLIIVDPPWENASAHQKSRYPTLPNRYFLSLPIKQLTHTEGALVALWVTNREKLRSFVERELFPAWGVSFAANFYWLKVKENGSLICDLDLFHHRPYECLILGYSPGKVSNTNVQPKFKPVKNDRVIMSIPADYSRKPPIADLLLEYIPGLKPPRCIELFAREIMAGWVAWGNEPLCFQDSRYFVKVMDK